MAKEAIAGGLFVTPTHGKVPISGSLATSDGPFRRDMLRVFFSLCGRPPARARDHGFDLVAMN